MPRRLRLTTLAALTFVSASCTTQTTRPGLRAARGGVQHVRTTAYTHSEGTGGRNAIGRRLSSGGIKSAASDWSRFPLGTRFKVTRTGQEYVIDDYGGALVGTSTIDLYTASRRAMYSWGVRHEEIEILHWGSDGESLKVLRSRGKVRRVRRMIASLENKQA